MFIDGDKMVAIQKLSFPETLPNVTTEQLNILKNFTFVIWQSDFSEIELTTGTKVVDSAEYLSKLWNGDANIAHQALLRKKPTTPEDPSIEDEFDCLFLQKNPLDKSSTQCVNEKNESQGENCEYWQTCDFKAVKGKDCEVIASYVAALVIPIVILLLGTAIFAIYCFKKKADKAEEANKEINDRLPVMNQQDSTRSNDKRASILESLSKPDKNGSLKKSTYNSGLTPG